MLGRQVHLQPAIKSLNTTQSKGFVNVASGKKNINEQLIIQKKDRGNENTAKLKKGVW